MITINRTFDNETGLLGVENLSGVIFSPESYAHEFVIERTDEYGFDGDISARMIRADGVTVFVQGTVSRMVYASVILPPECYAVPGPFALFIFHIIGNEAQCIYAGRGTVLEAESEQTTADTGTIATIDEQIQAILNRLSTTINTANLVALFARNIGEVEGEIETFQTTVDGIVQALAAADVRALNGPNMLPYQPSGVECNVPDGTVIVETITIPIEDATAAATTLSYTVTNASITAGMVLHYYKSSDTSVIWYNDSVTGTASAGSMAVSVAARSGAHEAAVTVTLYICAQTTAVLPYGEEARIYWSNHPWLNSSSNPLYTGDPGEEITERVVTLTGTDIVTEEDGASYDTAVAFTVANAPASGYNNNDLLVFNHGTDGGTGTRIVEGVEETYTYGPSGILDMVDGEKYTLSCWARITNGTRARLVMNYGADMYGYAPYADGSSRKYFDITNTAWERVYFTFTYHATIGAVELKKRVGVGVCRYADGTVQLCGFRLVHGGLFGDNTVDTLALDVAEAQDEVAALESEVSDIVSAITPNVETSMAATAAYSAGDIIAVGAKLYQATAAIASGDTLAVGTNIAAITLVDYIAQVTS